MSSRVRALLRPLVRICLVFEIDLHRVLAACRGLPQYARNLLSYVRAQDSTAATLRLQWSQLRPRLADRYDQAGVVSGHYFHQDLWAARHIFDAAPIRHHDVGSRIDGFVAHLLSFRGDVTVFDIRKLDSSIDGLTFVQADATALPLPDRSIESLSCLHAAEHFGLGRYSDPIAPNASFVAMRELQRVLAPGGRLYFSVPIGRERLEFDAHRIFAASTVIATFDELRLLRFGAIDDTGRLHDPAEPGDFRNAHYACGLFLLERPT